MKCFLKSYDKHLYNNILLLRSNDMVIEFRHLGLAKIHCYNLYCSFRIIDNNLYIVLGSILAQLEPLGTDNARLYPYNCTSDKYSLFPLRHSSYARYKLSGESEYKYLDLFEIHIAEKRTALDCFSLSIERKVLNLSHNIRSTENTPAILSFSISPDNKVIDLSLRLRGAEMGNKELESIILDAIISMVDITFKPECSPFDYSDVLYSLQTKYKMTDGLKLRFKKLSDYISTYNNKYLPW